MNCIITLNTVGEPHGIASHHLRSRTDLPAACGADSRGGCARQTAARRAAAVRPRAVAQAGRQPQHDRPRLYRARTRRSPLHAPRLRCLRGRAGERADEVRAQEKVAGHARRFPHRGRSSGVCPGRSRVYGGGTCPAVRMANSCFHTLWSRKIIMIQPVRNLAIETRGLTKYYGGRPVVHALDLNIPVGCVYGFLGRNGAGKSTTIKMLTGMVRPDFGEARLLGQDATQVAPATRAKVAYLAEGHPLYGHLSIAAMERLTRAFYPHWNQALFDQIIDHFELPRKKRIRR